MSDQRPREWFAKSKIYYAHPGEPAIEWVLDTKPSEGCIHVIEKSAYDELKIAYDEKCENKNGIPPLCIANQMLLDMCVIDNEKLRADLDLAIEELKYYADGCPIQVGDGDWEQQCPTMSRTIELLAKLQGEKK